MMSVWTEVYPLFKDFDGYHHQADRDAEGKVIGGTGFGKCSALANAALEAYEANGVVPMAADDLKACLFFEYRRWRHFGVEPDENAAKYIRALAEGLTARGPAP